MSIISINNTVKDNKGNAKNQYPIPAGMNVGQPLLSQPSLLRYIMIKNSAASKIKFER